MIRSLLSPRTLTTAAALAVAVLSANMASAQEATGRSLIDLTSAFSVGLVVIGAAVIVSGILAIIQPPGYKAQTVLAFSAPPTQASISLPGLDQQNRGLFAEQAVDDFTKIVPTFGFSEGVAKRLPFPMPASVVERSWTVKKQAHHLLSIEAGASSEERAVALAKAAAE